MKWRKIQINTLEVSSRRIATYLVFYGLRLKESKSNYWTRLCVKGDAIIVSRGFFINIWLLSYLVNNRLRILLMKTMSKGVPMNFVALVNYVTKLPTISIGKTLLFEIWFLIILLPCLLVLLLGCQWSCFNCRLYYWDNVSLSLFFQNKRICLIHKRKRIHR